MACLRPGLLQNRHISGPKQTYLELPSKVVVAATSPVLEKVPGGKGRATRHPLPYGIMTSVAGGGIGMRFKRLILGSAAALVVVPAAQAADAVVIAEPEPMEYVQICDTYGVGFYYIPGTETCLKVSGYIRMDVGGGAFGLNDVLDKKEPFDYNDFEYNLNDTYDARARFQLRLDSRAETELGTLRTYAAINFEWETEAVVAPFDEYAYTDAVTNVSIEHAYLQLGGFRVGKTDSLFSTFTGYAGGVINDDIIGYGPYGTHQIAYGWANDSGFGVTVALEGATAIWLGHSFPNPWATLTSTRWIAMRLTLWAAPDGKVHGAA
jgi:hypothetical protein